MDPANAPENSAPVAVTQGQPGAPAPAPTPAPQLAPQAPAPQLAPQAPAPQLAPQAPAPQLSPQLGTPQPQPAPTPQPSGTGWFDTIEDQRLREYASRFASPTDIVDTALKLREEVSKRIKPLDNNATPEDRAKYYKAMGVPETPDQYQFVLPPEVKVSDADKALLAAVLPIAHEAGIPGDAMNKFVGTVLSLTNQVQAEVVNVINEYGKQQETALRREWGKDYDNHVQMARRAASVIGGDEFRDFLNSTTLPQGGLLGDHPQVVKFLATIGRRTGEGDLMIGTTKEERESIQQQINTLNAQVPPGSPGYTQAAHQAKLQQLYGQLGSAPIVGSTPSRVA
jgi:hypothetical protein